MKFNNLHTDSLKVNITTTSEFKYIPKIFINWNRLLYSTISSSYITLYGSGGIIHLSTRINGVSTDFNTGISSSIGIEDEFTFKFNETTLTFSVGSYSYDCELPSAVSFNQLFRNDITIASIKTPEYSQYILDGEIFDLENNIFQYTQVEGSDGTIADILTENPNQLYYIKEYMRGLTDVEHAIKLNSADSDTLTFSDGSDDIIGDNLFLRTVTNSNGVIFNINSLTGNTFESGGVTMTITTTHADGQLHIENDCLLALPNSNSSTYKLSATDIDFDNAATNSGAINAALTYTDSEGEVYPLSEGEGDLVVSLNGVKGSVTGATWLAGIRKFLMKIVDGKRTFFRNITDGKFLTKS